jgi:poly-gamma-glutamate capsule biosynthesis protein CapA/YwtB (metallophosphatase superfamily)
VLGIIQRKNLPDFSFGSNTKVTHFTTQSADSLQGYYQKAQSLGAQNSQTATVTFLAVGDINLSRNVAAAIKEKNDFDYPFAQMANILKSTAFNFANLESPFSAKPIIGGHTLIFAAPTSTLKGLLDNNFLALNLANNHAFDGGVADLSYTINLLDQNGIKHMGTSACHPDRPSAAEGAEGSLNVADSSNLRDSSAYAEASADRSDALGMTAEDCIAQAWQPAIADASGLKICFVGASYASANDGGKTRNNYVARIEDLDRLKSVILNLKSACDFIVATMHAGTEYTRKPNQSQLAFAHAAIDFGADVVIGAHPHWVQTIEKYKNNYIFYSLGNFIFDQDWSKETSEGLALKITLNKNSCHPDPTQVAAEGAEGSLNAGDTPDLRDSSPSDAFGLGMTNIGTCGDDLQGQRQGAKLEQIELIPVIINNSQPRPASGDETKKILEKIEQSESILKP